MYADMRRQAREDFARIGIPEAQMSFQASVEMRYVGQFHDVELDLPEENLNAVSLEALQRNFNAKYEKMYTYSMPWREAEFHTFRLRATAERKPVKMAAHARAAAGVDAARRGSRACLFDGNAARVEAPAYDWDRMEPGHRVSGPALIDDKTTTVLVLPGFTSEVDAYRNLLLRSGEA